MSQAYACKITEENFGALRSEKPDFDADETIIWLEENGPGWFIRDENNKQWDCVYMAQIIFSQIYLFETFEPTDIFHRIKLA